MSKCYSTRDIMNFRQATGLSVLDAKNFLREHSQILCDKILLAYKLKQEKIKQGLPTKVYLYDPIEDDPEYSEIIKEVKQKAQIAIDKKNQQMIEDLEEKNKDFFSRMIRMGSINSTSVMTKEHLLEQHNIQWFSFIEMNPGTIFN